MMTRLCTYYQSLFKTNHPVHEKLVASFEDEEQFGRQYFDSEVERFTLKTPNDSIASIEGMHALDFGCGGGGITWAIGRSAASALGIDVDESKIVAGNREIERRGGSTAKLQHYDGETIPAADESFDIVFCIDVIEHVPDPVRAIEEFVRVLKPGGILRIGFGPPWYHAHGKHCWHSLPGPWTHLIFPTRAAMAAGGYPPDSTWSDLGMNQMSVRRFRRLLRHPLLEESSSYARIRPILLPLKFVPGVRELFIGAIGGIWRKKGGGGART